MAKFLWFLYGFAIINHFFNEGNLQDFDGGEGGDPNALLLNLLKNAALSGGQGTEAYDGVETTAYVMQGEDEKPTEKPNMKIQKVWRPGWAARIMNMIPSLGTWISYLFSLLNLCIQMVFLGIFRSSRGGGLSATLGSYFRLLRGLLAGFMNNFPSMVRDTILNFFPNMIRNLG